MTSKAAITMQPQRILEYTLGDPNIPPPSFSIDGLMDSAFTTHLGDLASILSDCNETLSKKENFIFMSRD